MSVLVKDGRMLLEIMKTNRVSRERLQAELRSQGIANLGQVKRAYLETSGDFTFFLHQEPSPGLSLIPEWNHEMRKNQDKAENTFACNICGKVVFEEILTDCKCDTCGHKDWSPAVLSHENGSL
nr:YetF domain-containing protein [Pontibacter beigongshangensis]